MQLFGAFTRQLMEFERETMNKVTIFTRAIALEVFRRIILKTPVDTGRARANWICTIAAPAEATTDDWLQGTAEAGLEFDTSGRAVIQAAADEVMAWNPSEVAIFLTNNLPYIQRLEDGSSKQAPAGMVDITIAEFDGIVARVAA